MNKLITWFKAAVRLKLNAECDPAEGVYENSADVRVAERLVKTGAIARRKYDPEHVKRLMEWADKWRPKHYQSHSTDHRCSFMDGGICECGAEEINDELDAIMSNLEATALAAMLAPET